MNPRMETTGQVLNIPIEDIIPNRFQPRLSFDEEGLKELASSIKEHGIIQPLVLRRLNDKYEIIAGERRYKAAKMAGLASVPGIIAEMDDKRSAEVAIVENVQRRDLTSIEEAKSYKALLDKGYLTQEELAKKMGLSQSAVANKLRLLSLAPAVQDALMEGKISERHARSLLTLDDLTSQEKWLDVILNERLTVKELDRRLSKEKASMKENDSNNDIPKINLDNELKISNEENDEQIYDDDNNKISFFDYITKQLNATMNNINDDEDNNIIGSNPIKEDTNPFNNALENAVDSSDIELLDFEMPSKETKDMNKVNTLIDELVNNLKNDNYTVIMNKDDNDNTVKFEITVNKG